MGNSSSAGLPTKSTGRLSQDEALAILDAFGFYRLPSRDLYRSKSDTVTSLTVDQFLEHFPNILQPFLAALLVEFRNSNLLKKAKTGGKLTADHLIVISEKSVT